MPAVSWRDPVRRFLVSSVDDRELRRIWSYHDPERAAHLPGTGASLAQLIDATVNLLTRERDLEFFDLLAGERPRRSQEIDELAALWTARADESTSTAEGPRWFPYPRAGSERFVGRTQELARLHDLLTRSRMVGITAQIRGLGGVGKTLLAVEYARRHGDAWPGGVFWIEADPAWSDAPPTGPERLVRRHSVLAGFAASLGVAQIPGQPEASAAAVEQALAAHTAGRRYLWILDGLPPGVDQLFVESLLPASPEGALLITTRWMALDALPNRLDLGVLAADAAYALLTARRAPHDEAEAEAARALAADVGHHPLALDVLGALVRDDLEDAPYADWRARLAAPGDDLERSAEALHDQLPTGAARAITRVLGTSLARLKCAHSLDLLRVAASLGDAPIPGALLRDILDRLRGATRSELAQAVAELAAHALVTRIPEVTGIHVHAIVRRVARRLPNAWPSNPRIDVATCEALGERFAAADDFQQHRRLLDLMPHADHASRGDVPESIFLGGNLGHFAQLRGDYPKARRLAERAIQYFAGRMVPVNPFMADARNNLAVALKLLGDLAGAELHFGQALIDYQQLYGQDDRRTLMALHNVGTTFEARGDHAAARRVYEQVYAAQQRALGPTDRDTLRTRIHLGGLLSDTGDLAGARALLEPSLPEFTAALGADHPLTRSLLGFLAVVLKRQGDLVPARALEERLLREHRRILSEDHPETLLHAQQLARTMQMQGELADAASLAETTLGAQRRVQGPAHPLTLQTQHTLAVVRTEQHDLDTAQPLMEATLAAMTLALGPDHPHVWIVEEDLAWIFAQRGEHGRARELLERVLARRVATLRPGSSDIHQVRYKLARTLLTLGEREAAQPHLAELEPLRTRHPDELSRTERTIVEFLGRSEPPAPPRWTWRPPTEPPRDAPGRRRRRRNSS